MPVWLDRNTSWLVIVVLFLSSILAQAGITFTDWEPMFKGVEHASGQATVDASPPRLQAVQALRIDLHDPDVRFFTTPRNTNGTSETLGQNTSLFLNTYHLQAAINANFYDPCCSSPPNSPMNVTGLSVCTGVVVSAQESLSDSANLLITRNNTASIVANNFPPQGTNGIYTAVSGHYVVLANGVNLGFSTPEFNTPNPRTAVGISQDGRYLIMMVIDGRQPGWSDGAVDSETADWLIRFGSFNGVNLDGGGSSAMVKADDCEGSAIQLNRPIDAGIPGHERVIGNNFGVYAKALPNVTSNVVILPSDATATITWQTADAATGRIEYGTTPNYGTLSTADPTPLRNHVVTLNGLSPNTTYYFRINSTVGATVYTFPCRLVTTSANASITRLFGLNQAWKFTTNNLDGINWQASAYNDGSWAGPGPGVLYCEDNGNVPARTTPLPSNTNTNGTPGPGTMASTYYFRTHFTFNRTPSAAGSLNFSNYVDDGGVFYLNGAEVQRLRMPDSPQVITYTTFTTGGACGGSEATCPDIFSISGPLVATNLHSGDNVLAAEIHQSTPVSSDVVFGSALFYSQPATARPTLNLLTEGNHLTFYWNGAGFTLQQSANPGGPWTDVPGPVTNSTYAFEIPDGVNFFRLRN